MFLFPRKTNKKEDKEQTELFRKVDGRLIRYASRIVESGEEILVKQKRSMRTRPKGA